MISDKFEVSASTGYEDMKGDGKCEKHCFLVVMGHARSLELTSFDSLPW